MLKWLLAGIVIGVVAGSAATAWFYAAHLIEAPPAPGAKPFVSPTSLPAPRQADAPSAPSEEAVAEPLPEVGVLAAMMDIPSDFEQTVMLYNLIRHADADYLDALLDEADTLRPRREGNAAKSIIFGRYAEVDPERALARMTARGEERFLSGLFRAWTKHDVDAAVAAAETLGLAHRRSAGAAILSVTERLADDQRTLIAEEFSAQGTLERMKADEALEVDPALAWREAIASEPGQARFQTLWHVARRWLQSDPGAALRAVDDLASEQAMALRSSLTAEWVQKDREAALAWVLAQPASAERVQMVQGMAIGIAQNSPEEALDLPISSAATNAGKPPAMS